MPPRHGKSEFTSRWLPAWYALEYPERRSCVATYGAEFAREWGVKAREIVKEWHRPLGRPRSRISQATSAAHNWQTIAGGGMVTAGVGGPLTGRGFHLMVIDDPIKNAEDALSPRKRRSVWDWFQSTAASRLEPGGVMVVMATRWHRDDLIGMILEQAAKGERDPVIHLHLPAIAEADDPLRREEGEALWPERWPIDSLESIRRATEPYWWNALYQGRPTREGRMRFPDDYFEPRIWVDTLPTEYDYGVIAVDPSQGRDVRKGDYAAVTFVGASGGRLWVDPLLGRWPVRQLCEQIVAAWQRYRCVVALEANAWQSLLAPEIDRVCAERSLPPLPIRLIENRIAKEVRIDRLGTYLSRDVLRFRATNAGRLLIEQLREFPHGAHDDGPDSLEMGIRVMQTIVAEDHEAAAYGDQEVMRA